MTRPVQTTEPGAPAATGDDRPSPAWRRRLPVALVAGAALLAALPMLAAALTALDEQWRPTGDWAVLNLRVEDVGRMTPLVGPYSRYGWNHPGPLLYWLLAVPYRLLGSRPEALLAATGLLNAATAAAAVVVAWRRGRLPLALGTAAALGLLAHAMGPAILRDPWNPYVTVVPLVLFTLLAWSAAEGDRWAWPAALVVGSFLVQSHVGYALVVGAVGATAMVMAWRDRERVPLLPPPGRARTTTLLAVVAVAVVAWVPVLLDQVVGQGNLTDLARYFATADDRPAGLGVGVDQAALNLALPDAPWLGRAEEAGPDGAALGRGVSALVVPIAAFAVALVAACRTGARSAARLQVLVGVLVVAGVVATSRITGPVFGYLVRWWWAVACLWWLSVAWSAAEALRRWGRVPVTWWRPARTAGLAALALLTLLAVVPVAADAGDAPVPDPSATAVLAHVLRPTVEALDGAGPVLVVATGSVWGTTADAVRLELERNGIDVVAEPDDAYRLGEARSSERRTPVATVWVVSADAATEWLLRPEVTRLAGWDPLPLPERLAFLADEAMLREQLVVAGRPDLAEAVATGGGGVDREAAGLAGVDQDLLARVEATRRRGDPVAVYLGPVTDDPADPSDTSTN